jgi:hypothetical protein
MSESLLRRYNANSFTYSSNSSLRHEPVDLTEGDYVATKPFRGIHLNASGTVALVGIDEAETVFVLGAGTHALGGIGITAANTSLTTEIIVLY